MKAIGLGLEFELSHEVQAFFSEHDKVKFSVIAKRASIDPELMRPWFR
jgi:hypothetical protein